MALDTERPWITHFGPILATPSSGIPYLQHWIMGDELGRFDADTLTTTLNDDFANAVSLASIDTRPREGGPSQGSAGGGGSSGGGGGGTGGGGGW